MNDNPQKKVGFLSVLKQRVEKEIKGGKSTSDGIPTEVLEEILHEANRTPNGLNRLYTELKSMERPASIEVDKIFELFDTAPFGYYRLSPCGMIEDLNQTGASILNKSKSDLYLKEFKSFVCRSTQPEFDRFLQNISKKKAKAQCMLKLQTGLSEIYCRVEGTALFSETAQPINYYITLFDITESRKSELANFETNERLKMVMEASSTGILTIDLSSLAVYLDPFSCSLLGIEPSNFTGRIKNILRRIHPEDRIWVNRALTTAIAGNNPIDIEFRNNPEKGLERFLTVKGHKITLGDKSFFAGLLIDRTEQHSLELKAENLRLNQQKMVMNATIKAQEKERAALSQFLHDSICQLLYGIKLNLQSMQFSNRYKGPFQNINALLDRVIKETRDISYELTPSVFRDFGFIAGTKEMFQRLSTRTFSINLEAEEQMDTLNQNLQLYLFRILQELINNCIKHAEASVVEVRLFIRQDWVHVSVRDNGKGFGKSVDDALREGSGIRAIKNRLFLLNGTIRFTSSSRGSRVQLSFPNNSTLIE